MEEVREPAGEVVVEVQAATTCATDVKMWRHGHRILPPYPCAFGHETAGVRLDTGDRVLVSDSVACGACPPCRAGRPQICRAPAWVLGGFAERIAAPSAALHAIPDGLPAAGAAMAEPLAAAVHAVGRGSDAGDAAVLGGGPMGLMLAALLLAEGRTVTLADHHPERREQAAALGARAVERLGTATTKRSAAPAGARLGTATTERSAAPAGARLGTATAERSAAPADARHDLVFEAVGRPGAWRAAVESAAPGGVVVFVGGCPSGTEVALPAAPVHYEELDLRGAFHHSRAEVDRALALLAAGTVDWRLLAGETIGLDDLPRALAAPPAGPARKWIVDPRR